MSGGGSKLDFPNFRVRTCPPGHPDTRKCPPGHVRAGNSGNVRGGGGVKIGPGHPDTRISGPDMSALSALKSPKGPGEIQEIREIQEYEESSIFWTKNQTIEVLAGHVRGGVKIGFPEFPGPDMSARTSGHQKMSARTCPPCPGLTFLDVRMSGRTCPGGKFGKCPGWGGGGVKIGPGHPDTRISGSGHVRPVRPEIA